MTELVGSGFGDVGDTVEEEVSRVRRPGALVRRIVWSAGVASVGLKSMSTGGRAAAGWNRRLDRGEDVPDSSDAGEDLFRPPPVCRPASPGRS
jgi:hypothetical protein